MLLLGLAALWWSGGVLPIFRSAAPVREITEAIISGQRFRPGVLDEALTRMQRDPPPLVMRAAIIRAAALVELSVAEGASERKSAEEADQEIVAAGDRVRTSLATNPADSFLWLMIYSLKAMSQGFSIENIRYLVQSYATGPREGWIALRRSRMALSVFPMLSPAAQQRVVSEFVDLVNSEFVEAAASNLTTVGWPQRERLLNALQVVHLAAKRGLRKRLFADGIIVQIPGVDLEERPWH
ncbi:hypothetical protein I6F36_28125 [Bradyrhizobium sp. BRP19]|uniref:hypothetical protein n=1 Tax=Bradyrhizobium sp. BRP19 TaxID=2793823 RepID=UPI001CD4BE2A|nr:hypothetical protein [Bradyrhizobium sp. BRP19]MCA1550703.1 hypothetical protein [Bradyrhizobium sp. BRP19]